MGILWLGGVGSFTPNGEVTQAGFNKHSDASYRRGINISPEGIETFTEVPPEAAAAAAIKTNRNKTGLNIRGAGARLRGRAVRDRPGGKG